MGWQVFAHTPDTRVCVIGPLSQFLLKGHLLCKIKIITRFNS